MIHYIEPNVEAWLDVCTKRKKYTESFIDNFHFYFLLLSYIVVNKDILIIAIERPNTLWAKYCMI